MFIKTGGEQNLLRGKQLVERLKSRDLSLFPNAKSIAYYDEISQHIFFDTIERADVSNEHETSLKNMKIMAHELQHWADHLSTLWGQKSLISIYNSINTWEKSDEGDFWRLRLLWKEINNGKLSRYYTTTNNDLSGASSEPWKWALSAGLKFDSSGWLDKQSPVIFTRFRTQNDVPVARTPFSIGSLLEVNSMATEFQIHSSYLRSLDKDEQIVELSLLKGESWEWLYNPEFTMYTVAAHFAANSLGIDDIILAYLIAKEVSTICLNMSDDFYDQLRIPNLFAEVFGERNIELIKNRDKGYLFAAIFQNLNETYKGKENEIDEGHTLIDELLKVSNLPSLEEQYKQTLMEMETLKENIIAGPFSQQLMSRLNMGIGLYVKRGFSGYKVGNIFELIEDSNYAPFVFGDDLFESPNWIEYAGNFYDKLVEFNNICGL